MTARSRSVSHSEGTAKLVVPCRPVWQSLHCVTRIVIERSSALPRPTSLSGAECGGVAPAVLSDPNRTLRNFQDSGPSLASRTQRAASVNVTTAGAVTMHSLYAFPNPSTDRQHAQPTQYRVAVEFTPQTPASKDAGVTRIGIGGRQRWLRCRYPARRTRCVPSGAAGCVSRNNYPPYERRNSW